MRFDERVEEIEELLLRAVLAAEELDVVDQEKVERAVIALEVVERLVLVSAHHVRDIRFGMDVADFRGGVALQDVVAERLDEMRLAQTDTAIDEERVVGRGVLGHLQPGCPGELVRLARDERREGEAGIETRLLMPSRQRRRGRHARGRFDGKRRLRLQDGGRWRCGSGRDRFARAVGDGEGDGNGMPFGLRRELGDAGEETLLDPLQHEAVLREQPIAAARAFERERPDPGVELLRRQLLAKRIEAALPEKWCDRHAFETQGWRGGRLANGKMGPRAASLAQENKVIHRAPRVRLGGGAREAATIAAFD